ncbi:hypothetical protein HNO88_000322 [Novosphingobium chloroacetimidivorans]|uniref:Uncharacterized protein n=1 Tax=Novosphingobium chloroacetimidivorans TaxID=1428314 RepID=A0A7W7K6W3_9SPHN|nr:hypothetical protein [Novosphingobium chloroacetimidivorans]MBB4857025.1 hypothetical protein [Novosphingobium chloroacetimidivorans]
MIEDALRVFALVVWSAVFVAFCPGAARALKGGAHSNIDLLCLPTCFSAFNRLLFAATALLAPSLVPLAQVTGVASGIWLAIVGYKVVRHGD